MCPNMPLASLLCVQLDFKEFAAVGLCLAVAASRPLQGRTVRGRRSQNVMRLPPLLPILQRGDSAFRSPPPPR